MEHSSEELKGSPTSYKFPKLPSIPHNPTGTMKRVTTNLFRIKQHTSNYIYVYSVDFKESIPNDNTMLRKKIIRQMKALMEPVFKKYIFTGNNLFSIFDTGRDIIELPTPEAQIKAYFRQAYVLSLADLYNTNDKAKSQTCLTFFNIMVKSLLQSLKMIPVGRTGRSLIINEANLINEYNLSVVPGYKTSVKLCQTGLLLEIDYASRILSQSPLYWRLKDLEKKPGNYQEAARNEVKGRSVLTWYGNYRTYSIDDIDFGLNPNTYKFPTPEGLMSVTEYMYKKYKIEVKDKNQPLLLHIKRNRDGTEQNIYLVPELCAIAGLSDEMAGDYNAMKQISVYTKLNPDDRMKKVTRLLKLLTGTEETKSEKPGEENKDSAPSAKDICNDWKFLIDPNPVEVIARKAPPVRIKLKNGQIKEVRDNGQFDLKAGIFKSLKIDPWAIVFEEGKRDMVEEFVDTLYKAAKTIDIEVAHPQYISSPSAHGDAFINAIKNFLEQGGKPEVIVCILPGKSSSDYADIKRWATKKSPPILTQIVKPGTLRKDKIRNICANIALQINAKMGAELWQVESVPGIPRITMVIGIDISRDKDFTCLGVSASMNKNFTKYFFQVMKLEPNKEIAGTLGALVAHAVIKFLKDTKGKVPELIVIYRDGVGESQKGEVFEVEVEGILEKLTEKLKGKKPDIIFAVINKKQHTRFFQNGDPHERYGARAGKRGLSEASTLINPSPGTIIHSDIIDSNLYEFLIMPQYVNEGTGTPVRVHVIYNSSSISLIAFEDLTNALCYAYDNWQGPIRTPAPCKFAYVNAKLVSRYMKDKPNEDLWYKKYFL